MKVTCSYCETEFDKKPSHLTKFNYCSRACQAEHLKETLKGENNPNWKNAGIKICLKCGKEFKSYNKNSKYCSSNCFYSTHRTVKICEYCKKEFEFYNSRGDKKFCSAFCHHKYSTQEGTIDKICETCKKEFIIRKSMAKQRFCSNACVNKYKIDSGMYKGKNNPQWQGGISIKRNYRGEDWNIQRKMALERDEYKCQKCGEQIRVAVHHIIPWEISKNNDLKNLICLCCKCHMTEENSYRRNRKNSLWIRNIMKEKYTN